MSLAITDAHRELAAVARSFADRHALLGRARSCLDAPDEQIDDGWKDLAAIGWLGLHVPEAYGGQGYGLAELAVVIEELGRVVAPGPFLPTVIAAAVIAGADDEALAERWLPGLADGSVVGGVGFGSLVLGAGLADVLVVADGDDMIVVPAADATITSKGNLDHTRRVADVAVAPDAGTRFGGRPTVGAGGGPDPGGRRGGGGGPRLHRDGHRVRQGPDAVRPRHRIVHGRQAPLRQHARARQPGQRGGVGRRPQ